MSTPLITWVSVNSSMNKRLHVHHKVFDEITYPFPNNCLSLRMDKWFYPTRYDECNYLSMLEIKLIHFSKIGPWYVNGDVHETCPICFILAVIYAQPWSLIQIPFLLLLNILSNLKQNIVPRYWYNFDRFNWYMSNSSSTQKQKRYL